jgi:hypothetical protein
MKTLVIPFLLIFAGSAFAAEPAPSPRGNVHAITLPAITTELKPGPGREKVQGYCGVCHSVDYIVMQPPFAKGKWGEIVTKMIKAFGAPIPKDAAEEITGYLGTAYGK